MDKRALKRRSSGSRPGKSHPVQQGSALMRTQVSTLAGGDLIQWHPGFAAALDLELEANREDFVYEKEYNLNSKPLEIDLLVINTKSHIQIVNEIGRLFRRHNILEYLSDTFYYPHLFSIIAIMLRLCKAKMRIKQVLFYINRQVSPTF